jgi:hypothetical protein
MRLPALVSLALGLVIAPGCGDDGGGSGGAGGGAGGGTTTTTSGSTTTSSTGGAECEPPAPNPGAVDRVEVSDVQATARDEDGSPIADFDMQLCGVDTCLFGTTSVVGTVNFNQGAGDGTVDRPLFKPGDSLVLGKIGYLYDGQTPFEGIFPRLVDSDTALAAGASVTAAGATIEVPAGGVVVVDDLIYDSPEKQTFRAASIATDDVAAVTGDASFAMVYALGPNETLFCPPAKLTLDNYAGLAANAEVEFFVQEVNIAQHFGAYGTWNKIGEGTVSADGQTVSTNDDEGLPVLLAVAVRLKN